MSLFAMFDKAGVPSEPRWRSLLLFFREIKDNSQLSDAQKIAIQLLFAKILEQKDYSEKRLTAVLAEYHAILVKPYQTQVDSLAREAVGLVSDFQKMWL